MIAEKIPAIEKLSRDEKILLAYELLEQNDDIPEETEAAMVELVSAVLEQHRNDPEAGISYEDMKMKYRGRH